MPPRRDWPKPASPAHRRRRKRQLASSSARPGTSTRPWPNWLPSLPKRPNGSGAVRCYLQGREPASARDVLKNCVQLEAPEKSGPGWLLLGQAHSLLGEYKEALAAYEECWTHPGRSQYQARYSWSLLKIQLEGGYSDLAVAKLETNLEAPTTDQDPETLEKTLFLLGELHFRRALAEQQSSREDSDKVRICLELFEKARYRLELAVKQFPDSPLAMNGYWQLAKCCWFLAEMELRTRGTEVGKSPENRAALQENYNALMTQAIAAYDKVVDILTRRQKTAQLTGDEEGFLRQALFDMPACYIRLGNYDRACYLYKNLAALYNHRPESLDAMAHIRRCYYLMGFPDADRVQQATNREQQREALLQQAEHLRLHNATLDEMTRILKELDPKAFDGSASAHSRKDWLTWLEVEAKKDASRTGK